MKERPQLDEEALVRSLEASRALEDAPETLVERALKLWDGRQHNAAAPSRWTKFVAALVFDSAAPTTSLAGMRTATGPQRRLVFSVAGRDVDLLARRSGSIGGGWIVSGQVLGDAPGTEQRGSTTVRSGDFVSTVAWSPACEFQVEPVPPGDCVITLRGADWETTLPAFTLPAA